MNDAATSETLPEEEGASGVSLDPDDIEQTLVLPRGEVRSEDDHGAQGQSAEGKSAESQSAASPTAGARGTEGSNASSAPQTTRGPLSARSLSASLSAYLSARLVGLKPVFRREFRGYFSSPLGYIFVVIFLVASGYLMVSRDFGRFLELREASLDALFTYIPWILVVLVPAVAMRLWAEERKTGTVELLLSLPVTLEGAYLGKFLAGWSFLSVSILLTWPAMFQVVRLGDPDWGAVFAGYLGCLLVAGALLSIGVLFSALSKNQVVAFILAATVSVSFLLVGLPETQQALGEWLGGYPEQVLSSLSLVDHFETMTRGLIEARALLFFGVFTVGWLIAGMVVLKHTKTD